jgi:hypothetical protein
MMMSEKSWLEFPEKIPDKDLKKILKVMVVLQGRF